MSDKTRKTLVVIVLLGAIALVIFARHLQYKADSKVAASYFKAGGNLAVPALLELGSHKCIPCKMMAPILEELKKEYAGSLRVGFFDVWKNPDEAKKYGIKICFTRNICGILPLS